MPGRSRPLVVGIVNCTPDSFYDGGRRASVDDAIAHGLRLLDEGADWLDIGGESTRPGATPVDADTECARVLDVIRALSPLAPVSIDTVKPQVAARALQAGATIINDVTGLADPDMPAVTADARATIVMHMRGTPRTMRQLNGYGDVVAEVRDHLVERAGLARSEEVWIDPGIGFAKDASQSLALLGNLDRLADTGLPVLVGASRKSFIGQTLGLPEPGDRLFGSLAAVASAFQRGAGAVRVHDVGATRQLLDLMGSIDCARLPRGSGRQ